MVDRMLTTVYAGIDCYYTERLQRYGSTPRGVDWTCSASQELRFVQLMKLCDFEVPFSLNDVGCGYGALVGYLARRHARAEIDYLGIDLAAAMVRRARPMWRTHGWATFITGNAAPRPADYSVASGIFNVKLDQSRRLWERFVAVTLDNMHATSRKGFAVNFMLAQLPSSHHARGTNLYRCLPEKWGRHCEREFGSSVAIIDGYGQAEFTLLVLPKGMQPWIYERARGRDGPRIPLPPTCGPNLRHGRA